MSGHDARWRFRMERLWLPRGLGSMGGEALKRDPWQRELWELTDNAVVQVAFFVAQRGLGKSTLGGAIGVERICLRDSHEVVVIAADADQAALVFDEAKGFIERDEVLSGECEVYKGGKRIENSSTGSRFRVLTSDAVSNFGLGAKPTTYIIDEAWALPDRDLFDAFLSALPKSPGSQLLILSNAGLADSPAAELWKICGDDDPALVRWDSVEQGVWPSWMDEAERERQKRLLPPSVYRRLFENEWQSGSGDFLTEEQVAVCMDDKLDPHALSFARDRRYYMGIDLGMRHDRSVVVVGHKEREKFVVDHIRTWYGTPEAPVILEEVFSHVFMLGRVIPRLRKGLLDPWQGLMMLERLVRGGMRTVEEFTFTPNNIQLLSQTVWNAFRSGQARIPPYSPLVDELVSARVVEKRYGWRVDHQAGGFSDHLIAMGLAMVGAIPDTGEVVVQRYGDESRIELLKGKIKNWRRFGFGKKSGLTTVDLSHGALSGPEDFYSAARLLQLLERNDQVSAPEAAAIRADLKREFWGGRLRHPGNILQFLRQSTDDLDNELGNVGLFYEDAPSNSPADAPASAQFERSMI